MLNYVILDVIDHVRRESQRESHAERVSERKRERERYLETIQTWPAFHRAWGRVTGCGSTTCLCSSKTLHCSQGVGTEL